jgi:S-adenosylmethionine synthetase
VAAELADCCEVQLAYAIGVAQPVCLSVTTFGTGKVPEGKLEKAVIELFDCTPGGIITTLDLLQPIYQETATYGHFGRDDFSWEKTDKVDILREKLL